MELSDDEPETSSRPLKKARKEVLKPKTERTKAPTNGSRKNFKAMAKDSDPDTSMRMSVDSDNVPPFGTMEEYMDNPDWSDLVSHISTVDYADESQTLVHYYLQLWVLLLQL